MNDYYPFGLRWYSNGNPLYKYKFGGKELQTELNLNTYDFHARQQDPQLGWFWGVDPMADERVNLSSFNYVQNNPIGRVDPTGMLDTDFLNKKTGETHHIEDGINQIAMVDDETFGKIKELNNNWNLSWDKDETNFYFKSIENSTLFTPNEFGMFQFPESGTGFGRYTTESGKNNGNNENYSVGGEKHTTDNWASSETFLSFYKTIQDFYSVTGVTVRYGDISAYNPKIYLGHSTHYTGKSIDIHYFDTKGSELRGTGAYAGASIGLVNNFFQHSQNNGFTKNYSYGNRFNHIGNNNQNLHKDHLHIGR